MSRGLEIWERLLDRYGLAVSGLLALAWVVYKVSVKVLIPYLNRQDERIEARHGEMIGLLNTQLDEARKTRSEEVARFTQTVNGALAEQTAVLRAVAEGQRALIEEVRRGGR